MGSTAKRTLYVLIFAIVIGVLFCVSVFRTTQHTRHAAEKRDKNDSVNQTIAGVDHLEDQLRAYLDGRDILSTTDEMDGKRSYSLTLTATKGDGRLLFRCSPAKDIEAYIAFDSIVESNAYGRSDVRLRFDDGRPASEWWPESKDYKAVFAPTPKKLISQLRTAKTFMFEHPEFHGGREVATFDLTNLGIGLPKLLAACGMSQAPSINRPKPTGGERGQQASQVNTSVYGDPLAKIGPPSNGPGSGDGIGSGSGGGVGSGKGGGFGPGEGGDLGGGVYRVGGGVTAPVLLYKKEPEYSEEARKAKYQGTVLLYIEVDPSGKATNIRVQHSLGLGLDEKAIEAVRQWKFKPGYKDGKPVTVAATIEVNFRLL